jgi:membrane protein YdbS with pleckstrin-like domain
MYCGNCGADIPATLRFCTVCGAPTDNEETRVATEETRVAQPRTTLERVDRSAARAALQEIPARPAMQRAAEDADIEHVIFTVRPTFLFIGLGYALAALGAIALTVLLAYFSRLPAYYVLPGALLLLLIPAWKHLKRNALKYTLTDAKIEIDEGLFSRRTRNIPLRNIQDVTVAASLTQRLLGFGNLLIDNASELGGMTIMHNIPKPRRHADLILRELRRWH